MEKQEDRRGKERGQRGGKRSTRKEKKGDVRGRGETKEEEGRARGRRRRKRGSGGTHAAVFRPTTSSGAGLETTRLPWQSWLRGAGRQAGPGRAASVAPAPHARGPGPGGSSALCSVLLPFPLPTLRLEDRSGVLPLGRPHGASASSLGFKWPRGTP